MRMMLKTVALVLVALAWSVPMPAAETVRYSGTVTAADPERGTIVLDEVGPWRLVRGQTQTMKRTVMISTSTQILLARRAEKTPSGFPNDFVTAPLTDSPIFNGDFVTVECQRQGKRLTAITITVVRPGAP